LLYCLPGQILSKGVAFENLVALRSLQRFRVGLGLSGAEQPDLRAQLADPPQRVERGQASICQQQGFDLETCLDDNDSADYYPECPNWVR
jgi:hypothetical protein